MKFQATHRTTDKGELFVTVRRSFVGVDETDGKDNWGWRKSAADLIKRARAMIDEKNPKCELAIDGGLRHNNMEPAVACNQNVIILSSAVFKDPDGIHAGVSKCRKAIDMAAE